MTAIVIIIIIIIIIVIIIKFQFEICFNAVIGFLKKSTTSNSRFAAKTRLAVGDSKKQRVVPEIA